MKNKYVVKRGLLEDDKRRQENKTSNQKIALILLPIFMIFILIVGIFFGYKSYTKDHPIENVLGKEETLSEVTVESTEKLKDSDLLLRTVNSSSPLEKDFVPELVEYRDVLVSPLMKDDLDLMLNDAKSDGLDIQIKYAYISYEEQSKIFDEAVKKYKNDNDASLVKAESEVRKKIAKAGESEAQTGLLIYFYSNEKGPFASKKEYNWLDKNSVKYGFVQRYIDDENVGGIQYSSNLFRYVGKDNAIKMRAINMNFEQYVTYLHKQ